MRRHLKKPVSFLDFQSPNRSHGGSNWIAHALLQICDMLVEQSLNLRSLNSSLRTSWDKRETTTETVSEWQQLQPPCILRGNYGLPTEIQEKRWAYFSAFSSKIWHSRVICVFLRWGLILIWHVVWGIKLLFIENCPRAINRLMQFITMINKL